MEKFDDYTAECSGKISNSTETMYLSKLDEGQCRELGDFRGCIAEKLQICKAPGIIDLIDIFYKPMVKASSCAKVNECNLSLSITNLMMIHELQYINFEQRDPVESNEI